MGGPPGTLIVVPGSSGLDFRDVHAVDERTAYLLSIGEGEKSRIYKTTDGGERWTLQLTLHDTREFLDAIAFWDAEHGLALGDPIAGRFLILTTDDGGSKWTRRADEVMPPSLPGEGAFAASGTCLVAAGAQNAWFATGGARRFPGVPDGRSRSNLDVPRGSDRGRECLFRDLLAGVSRCEPWRGGGRRLQTNGPCRSRRRPHRERRSKLDAQRGQRTAGLPIVCGLSTEGPQADSGRRWSIGSGPFG